MPHTEIGTIKSITTEPMLDKSKKVIELRDGKECRWVDCISEKTIKKLESLNIDDVVEVIVFNSGSISRKTGHRHNNGIVKHIKKL